MLVRRLAVAALVAWFATSATAADAAPEEKPVAAKKKDDKPAVEKGEKVKKGEPRKDAKSAAPKRGPIKYEGC